MGETDETLDAILTEIEIPEAEIVVRSASKREIDVRLMEWGHVIQSTDGEETFARGAFDGIDPSRVILRPPEHEVRLALGHDGKPKMMFPATGKAIAYTDREDGPVFTFKVARTQAGDEQLALAEDGITTGVSAEFIPVAGGHTITRVGGRRRVTHHRVDLRGVTTTYRPAYGDQAAVLAVRSQQEDPKVGEDTQATPVVDYGSRFDGIEKAIAAIQESMQARTALPEDAVKALMLLPDKIDGMQEQARAQFEIPNVNGKPSGPGSTKGDWASIVFRMLAGEKIAQRELEARVAADLITTDNLGVVPEAFLNEIVGIIDPARPFLNSTRKLDLPAAGMTLNVPVITTRPTTAIQAEEKDELASTPTSITQTGFDAVTIGGYGDISLQLLRRSDPSYLSLYLELLAEAYAIDADDKAVDVLLAASGIHDGGTVVADDGPGFGQAWANAAAVSRLLTPDTIWMNASAVQAFIDAKADGTNVPLYGNLQANFSAGGGVGGSISGLRPVYVPAMNDETADIIVGPSRAFGWTEDGTFTLQVDVPAKAGRDVALVGIMWYAPLYPAAFTKYAIGS